MYVFSNILAILLIASSNFAEQTVYKNEDQFINGQSCNQKYLKSNNNTYITPLERMQMCRDIYKDKPNIVLLDDIKCYEDDMQKSNQDLNICSFGCFVKTKDKNDYEVCQQLSMSMDTENKFRFVGYNKCGPKFYCTENGCCGPDTRITPSPETPSPETPSPETPSPETPSPETPSPETPSPETPSPETPSPETPSPETPSPETPSPETPSPETPSPETPSPETPSPETPSPETPSPETPSPETPSPETPSQETPSPETPSPETPSPETPSPETPSPETPSPETLPTSSPSPPYPLTPTTAPIGHCSIVCDIDWKSLVHCKEEGYFRNPYDCYKFYRCYFDTEMRSSFFDCPKDEKGNQLLWSNQKNTCVRESDAEECNNIKIPDPNQQTTPESGTTESETTTTNPLGTDNCVITESENPVTESENPVTESENPVTESENPVTESETSITEELTSETPIATSEQSTESTTTEETIDENSAIEPDEAWRRIYENNIQCQMEGQFRNPFNCRKFYKCFTETDHIFMSKVFYVCLNGLVYDEGQGKCVGEMESTTRCNDQVIIKE